MALIDEVPRMASARAVGKVVVKVIPRELIGKKIPQLTPSSGGYSEYSRIMSARWQPHQTAQAPSKPKSTKTEIYLCRKVIRPLDRSYGVISTSTLSPASTRMRNFRIFPAIRAMISWSFSRRTKNIALGNFSITVPVNSSSSSLAILPRSISSAGRFKTPRLALGQGLFTCSQSPPSPKPQKLSHLGNILN